MLIAEDLLLLLADDETGKYAVSAGSLDLALAGACLVELAQEGRIAVADDGDDVKKGRLMVRDSTPTGDRMLDEVLARCVDRAGVKPEHALSKVSKDVREKLLDRLADQEILRREQGKILGVLPVTRWPAVDSAHERTVLDHLSDALVHGVTPDERIAALAALLSAVDAAHKVVPSDDAKAVKKRAKELSEGDWAAQSVGKAVAAVQTAIITTMIATTAATSAAATG